MKNRYSNGMYKGESEFQSRMSQGIFKAFSENDLIEYMQVNFNQVTGNCEYTYAFSDRNSAYYVEIDRKGVIIQSGFTTK